MNGKGLSASPAKDALPLGLPPFRGRFGLLFTQGKRKYQTSCIHAFSGFICPPSYHFQWFDPTSNAELLIPDPSLQCSSSSPERWVDRMGQSCDFYPSLWWSIQRVAICVMQCSHSISLLLDSRLIMRQMLLSLCSFLSDRKRGGAAQEILHG